MTVTFDTPTIEPGHPFAGLNVMAPQLGPISVHFDEDSFYLFVIESLSDGSVRVGPAFYDNDSSVLSTYPPTQYFTDGYRVILCDNVRGFYGRTTVMDVNPATLELTMVGQANGPMYPGTADDWHVCVSGYNPETQEVLIWLVDFDTQTLGGLARLAIPPDGSVGTFTFTAPGDIPAFPRVSGATDWLPQGEGLKIYLSPTEFIYRGGGGQFYYIDMNAPTTYAAVDVSGANVIPGVIPAVEFLYAGGSIGARNPNFVMGLAWTSDDRLYAIKNRVTAGEIITDSWADITSGIEELRESWGDPDLGKGLATGGTNPIRSVYMLGTSSVISLDTYNATTEGPERLGYLVNVFGQMAVEAGDESGFKASLYPAGVLLSDDWLTGNRKIVDSTVSWELRHYWSAVFGIRGSLKRFRSHFISP